MKKPFCHIQGFSLIELMIVVAIIGILASIAYPSYTEYVLRSHRADAKTNLLQAAQWMERVATATGLYPTNTKQTAAIDAQEAQLSNARYVININSNNGSTFTISAVPQGAQAADKCGTLTVTNTGARSVTSLPQGSTMTAADCWNR